MFDKKRCKNCCFCMNLTGGKKATWVDDGTHGIMCGRSIILHETCIKQERGVLVDLRGDNPKKCALFKPKKSIRNGRLY